MPVSRLIDEFEYIESLSMDEIRHIQWINLQKTINHAIGHSPYYRRLFRELGAEAEDIRDEESFKKIPILTKSIIRRKARQILVEPKPRFLVEAKTSGSTGKLLKVYKDPTGRASTYAAMYRGHRWYGVDIGAREARLWGVPSDPLHRVATKFVDFLLNRFRERYSQSSLKTFKVFHAKMKNFRPEYLMGYPSLIHPFASFLQNAELDGKSLNLRFVKCTAEVISDYQKELIEEVFGCPCISEYGATETGVISFECPARNQHIMAESVYVEFEKYAPAKKEMSQKLIITNLYNRAFPIIRYEIGDLAYPQSGRCSCGRSLPLMSKVIGRVHDVIIGSNGKHFHSSIFKYIVKDMIKHGFAPKQIRFAQEEPGKIQAHIVKSSNSTCDHTEILKKIVQRTFKNAIDIEIKYFSELKRDPSGKFRYFVSSLKK